MTRIHLLIGVLLLTSSGFVRAESSSAVTDSTSVAPASTALPGSASPTTGSSDGSSSTVNPSATTLTGGTQPSDTTVTAASVDPSATVPTVVTSSASPGGSSQAPVTAGSTTQPPLPDVTVSVLQFDEPVCDETSCTYQFNAPGNSQSFLATEDSIVATDRSQYNSLQSQASQKDADIKKANDDAQKQLVQLQTLLNNIQDNINAIQNRISTIKSQQSDANAAIGSVQKFIDDVKSAPGNCLYQRCLKPTTPAPPTTTPTPAPTTPPSPCVNFTCPTDTTTSLHCQLDSYNKPNCNDCSDNFNGYDHCDTVACNSAGTGFVPGADGTGGVLYSTGYNKTANGSSLVPANANCRWTLNGNFTVPSAPLLNCLTSGNVVMYVLSSDGINQRLVNTTTLRSLNSLLSKISNPIFTLTSTSSDPTFCSIPLNVVNVVVSTKAPELAEQQKNGFFSWLMGY